MLNTDACRASIDLILTVLTPPYLRHAPARPHGVLYVALDSDLQAGAVAVWRHYVHGKLNSNNRRNNKSQVVEMPCMKPLRLELLLSDKVRRRRYQRYTMITLPFLPSCQMSPSSTRLTDVRHYLQDVEFILTESHESFHRFVRPPIIAAKPRRRTRGCGSL